MKRENRIHVCCMQREFTRFFQAKRNQAKIFESAQQDKPFCRAVREAVTNSFIDLLHRCFVLDFF